MPTPFPPLSPENRPLYGKAVAEYAKAELENTPLNIDQWAKSYGPALEPRLRAYAATPPRGNADWVPPQHPEPQLNPVANM